MPIAMAPGAVVETQDDVNLASDNEPDNGQGTVLDVPQSLDCAWREGLAPAT